MSEVGTRDSLMRYQHELMRDEIYDGKFENILLVE